MSFCLWKWSQTSPTTRWGWFGFFTFINLSGSKHYISLDWFWIVCICFVANSKETFSKLLILFNVSLNIPVFSILALLEQWNLSQIHLKFIEVLCNNRNIATDNAWKHGCSRYRLIVLLLFFILMFSSFFVAGRCGKEEARIPPETTSRMSHNHTLTWIEYFFPSQLWGLLSLFVVVAVFQVCDESGCRGDGAARHVGPLQPADTQSSLFSSCRSKPSSHPVLLRPLHVSRQYHQSASTVPQVWWKWNCSAV